MRSLKGFGTFYIKFDHVMNPYTENEGVRVSNINHQLHMKNEKCYHNKHFIDKFYCMYI